MKDRLDELAAGLIVIIITVLNRLVDRFVGPVGSKSWIDSKLSRKKKNVQPKPGTNRPTKRTTSSPSGYGPPKSPRS